MRRMETGRNNSEVERVIGGVCFPDSFQRKEICVVCCEAAEHRARPVDVLFYPTITFSGTFLLG